VVQGGRGKSWLDFHLPSFGGLDATTATAIKSATPVIKYTAVIVTSERYRIIHHSTLTARG